MSEQADLSASQRGAPEASGACRGLKIVRLANYVGPRSGGMRTALRELGAGYLAAGHEPVLVVPGRRHGDEQTAQGRVITRYGPVVPFTGGYRALLRRGRLAALLTELRPDRLEVSDRTTLRWTGRWAREHGVPAVMVSHESLTGLFSLPADVSGMSRWRSRLLSNMATALADNLNRRSVRDYRRIICTTRWAAAEFERIEAPNLTRIPLGVDLELFSPERYSDTVREQYAAPGQPLLVHCARLSVEKKPHRALTALAGLRAAGTDAVLVMAGDGPLRARLERAARRRSLPVRFTGFVTDPKQLATLLASADVVLAPGPVETFGLAALEALACGTPVVACEGPALREVLDGRVTFVPACDTRALIAAAESIERNAQTAPAWTWHDAARATWRTYERAVADGAAIRTTSRWRRRRAPSGPGQALAGPQ
jgi:alpha-1,6-mannosyltransferase